MRDAVSMEFLAKFVEILYFYYSSSLYLATLRS